MKVAVLTAIDCECRDSLGQGFKYFSNSLMKILDTRCERGMSESGVGVEILTYRIAHMTPIRPTVYVTGKTPAWYCCVELNLTILQRE